MLKMAAPSPMSAAKSSSYEYQPDAKEPFRKMTYF